MRKIDYTGQKFGLLKVTGMIYNYNNTSCTKCICECECGNKNIIKDPQRLKNGISWHCGCQRGVKQRIQMTGNKYGRLLVLEELFDKQVNMVRCRCDCGKIIIVRRHDVLSGHTQSCGCYQIEQTSKASFVDHSDEVSDWGIKIIKPTIKNKVGQQLWQCQCGICGSFFDELPARVLNGHIKSCGCVLKSYGEKLVEQILIDNNYNYICQYTFDDCVSESGYKLRYDFAVLINDTMLLIEYDGIQHYQPVEIFGGDIGYQETIKRDYLKNQYCEINGIDLLRLPYTLTYDEIKDKILNTLLSLTTVGNIK